MNNGDKMRDRTTTKLTNEELSASIAKRFHGKCGYDFCPAYEGNGSYDENVCTISPGKENRGACEKEIYRWLNCEYEEENK
jgi:hypothetical protein